MNPDMKHILFQPEKLYAPHAVQSEPPELYLQELDWTCALACVRSIVSGISTLPADSILVAELGLMPGPVYSDKIKASGLLRRFGLDARYGCDTDVMRVQDLYDLLRDNWRVMVNWMYSYDHWTVLLKYDPMGPDPDYHMMTHWDPYFGEKFYIRAGHFAVMWQSGGNERHKHDFIAVRERR